MRMTFFSSTLSHPSLIIPLCSLILMLLVPGFPPIVSVNPSKSKYMFFSLKHQSYFDSIPPSLLSKILFDRVYSFKYLGLILSCNLSWSSVWSRELSILLDSYIVSSTLSPLQKLSSPSTPPWFALSSSTGLPSGTLLQPLSHPPLNQFSTSPSKRFRNPGLLRMLISSLPSSYIPCVSSQNFSLSSSLITDSSTQFSLQLCTLLLNLCLSDTSVLMTLLFVFVVTLPTFTLSSPLQELPSNFS